MEFKKLDIEGAYLIKPDNFYDDRGFFSTLYSLEGFKANGIDFRPVQENFSYNEKKGTLRGMHYQAGSFAQAKLIKCLFGEIQDVLIDIREDSPTFERWVSVILGPRTGKILLAPKGVAHGFLTLRDNTNVHYLMDNPFEPAWAMGIRWNDSYFGIDWLDYPAMISDKDKKWGDW